MKQIEMKVVWTPPDNESTGAGPEKSKKDVENESMQGAQGEKRKDRAKERQCEDKRRRFEIRGGLWRATW